MNETLIYREKAVYIKPGTFSGYVAIVPNQSGISRKKLQHEDCDVVTALAKGWIDEQLDRELPVTLYTFGYQKQHPQTLYDHLKRLGAVLVDIRYSPHSRNPVWNGGNLSIVLGNRYVYLRSLGNVNYNSEEGIRIADIETGGAKVAAMMQVAPVILLCVCPNPETCHRKVVADALAVRYGWQVEHL